MKPLYVVLEWFVFRTLLVQPNHYWTYKEGCSQTICFSMFLWDEATLFIFEMVSFQASLIQPEDLCVSYRGCSKTIGFVFFYMKTLSDFLTWFHFKLCLYCFGIVWIFWKCNGKCMGFIMVAFKTIIKALLL